MQNTMYIGKLSSESQVQVTPMHTVSLLYKLLSQSVSTLHASRLAALQTAVHSILHGAQANVTSIGRNLRGSAYVKHKIKRADRLLSNQHLYHELKPIYGALTQRILKSQRHPIILVDWSPLCADQSWQLLRAAIPVGGRTLTLYEEVHPLEKLGNRQVQHRFMNILSKMLADDCQPIVIADSGFRTPFYRYIEETLGWNWLGRIRGRDFVAWKATPDQWFSAKLLHSGATSKSLKLGEVKWVKNQSLSSFLVLVKKSAKSRQSLTLAGQKRRSRHNKIQSRHQTEPWLLVASLSLHGYTAKQIVNLYGLRMQIEEGFRDCKSTRYGLGLSQHRHTNLKRRSILCLLVSLASFMLWCIGHAAQNSSIAKQVRVNSSSRRKAYSDVFLARILLRQKRFRIRLKQLEATIDQIQSYCEHAIQA